MIVNLYACSKNFESKEIDIFQNLYQAFLEFKRGNLILGGDLNLYLNPRVVKLDPLIDTNDNSIYQNEILSFLETENLIDNWRVVNHLKQFFTWHTIWNILLFSFWPFPNKATSIGIMFGIHSNHNLLKFSIISHTEHKTWRGFWKFITDSLQYQEYVKYIKDIVKAMQNTHDHIKDKNLIWETIKLDIPLFMNGIQQRNQ